MGLRVLILAGRKTGYEAIRRIMRSKKHTIVGVFSQVYDNMVNDGVTADDYARLLSGSGAGFWQTDRIHSGKYTDAMVMFRAYKTSLFRELDLDKDASYAWVEKLFHTMVGIEPLLSIRAAKRKLKVADIPGDEPKRIGGNRKLQILRWGAAYLAQVFGEVFIWR